jgi:hypothetical protein
MRHGIALSKIHIQHAWEASECFEVQTCTVSLLVGELVGGELSAGLSQTTFGVRRKVIQWC